MTDRVLAFLDAARGAEALLAEPAVAAGWAKPSALPEMTVGGLAAHLAFQVLSVPPVLKMPDDPTVPLVGLREYYERAGWRGSGPKSEVNAGIRAHAEDRAGDGPDELVAAVRAALSNVDVHVGPDAPAWVLLEDLDGSVEISVRDEGPGIPEGRLAVAEADGRLGVSRSLRGRVADLGGTIMCDTGPDRGTEWIIRVGR